MLPRAAPGGVWGRLGTAKAPTPVMPARSPHEQKKKDFLLIDGLKVKLGFVLYTQNNLAFLFGALPCR